ncbi:MAG TPA: membrane protein insertase YidC [Rhodocyclaceae bacterium]|nr:membrane protein insertase YidC [Rhodocyclaceae bacterium]
MDTQRLILLLVFTFSLVMIWEGWQKRGQPKAPPAAAAQQTQSAVPTPTPTPGATSAAPVPDVSAVPGAGQPAANLPKAVVVTDLVVADVSAQGGEITRLELKQYQATEDKSSPFVLFDSGTKHVYLQQSGLIGEGLPNHKTVWTLQPGRYELKPGEDTVQLRLEAPEADGVKVAKLMTFHRGSYVVDIAYEIENKRAANIAPHAYFQLTRDGKPPEGQTAMLQTYTGAAVFTDEAKYQKLDFEDIAKGKVKLPQGVKDGWIGMVQHYFVSALLPRGNQEREFYARQIGNDLYSAGVILPVGAVAPGASARVEMPVYAGPQEQSKLEKLAPGLDLVVDYGWLTVIAAPLFWVLEWLHGLVGNWGWAIILLTVIIKAIFFPLSAASYKSMAKMRVVTPKMMKIKELYGNDRARMNQEMMELYKKEKINPLGGCLPILVQIPVFIALYWVLLNSVEMRQAPWILWIDDLSAKDPYFILPIIMGVTMLIQTKLNPTPPDPIQAKVMMAMPIVFTGMFLFFPAGLVLYWVVNNVLSIGQQWQITRMIEGGGNKAKPA